MNQIIYQKTQELSFALIRVAGKIRRFGLKNKIEELGYHLLENVTYRNHELALHAIDTIQGFIDLGKNVYEIEPRNHAILTRELRVLAHEIQDFSGEFPVGNLENIFTKVESIRIQENTRIGNTAKKNGNLPHISSIARTKSVKPKIQPISVKKAAPKPINTAPKTEKPSVTERKESILAAVKAAPEQKMQLKEIADSFTEVSERTLRYDLKSLMEENKLDRIGSGPASFYAAKQGNSPVGVIN